MGSTLWYFKKDDQKGEGYTLYPRRGSTVAVKYVKEKLENYFHQKKYKKIFPEYKEGIHEVGLNDERLFLQYKDMEADPRAAVDRDWETVSHHLDQLHGYLP